MEIVEHGYFRVTRDADYEISDEAADLLQALQVEPGKFAYRLVRAELTFDDYDTVEARVRIDLGPATTVPFTLLPPVDAPS